MDIFNNSEIIIMITVVSIIIIGFVVSIIIDIINYRDQKDNSSVAEPKIETDYLTDDVNDILLEEENDIYRNEDVLIEEVDDSFSDTMTIETDEIVNDDLVIENNEDTNDKVVINELETNHNDSQVVSEAIVSEIVEAPDTLVIDNDSDTLEETKSNIVYKDGISQDEAKAELESMRLKLEQEEIEERFEQTVTNFELEQEEDAIISLDELKKVSDDLYESNEPMQYDDGNEPISINEIMTQYNTINNSEPVTKVTTDSISSILNTNKDVVVKESNDFLEELEEAYHNN